MPFILQPVLEGESIRLRPLREDDFPELFEVASDPLIWEQHPQSDRYREEVFREFFRGALASGGAFVVLDRRDGRIVGSTRFHGYDEDRSEIEIGWTFLARSHWGGASNREMKRLMLEHAFKYVESVVFHVGERNHRSQKALEKIGAQRIGERRDADGKISFIFQITPARFAQNSAA